MTIPRNLSFLAEGASSTGVLGVSYGGTGAAPTASAVRVLVSNGASAQNYPYMNLAIFR
jgi:hypothetical protein